MEEIRGRKTLLHAALQAGYKVSDGELDQIIEKEKENLQDPDVKELPRVSPLV